MSTPNTKLSQLRARVAEQGRNFAKAANLNATVTPPGSEVNDPEEQGGVTAKVDPDGSGITAGKPSDAVGGPSNPTNLENPNGVTGSVLVANPGANSPTTKPKDGDAIDDRADDSALKSAARAAVNAGTILQRFRNGGKAASAPGTAPAAVTPAAAAPKQATAEGDQIVTSSDLSSYKMAAAIQLVDALGEVDGGIEFGVELLQRKMGRDAAIAMVSNALAERNDNLEAENIKMAAVQTLNAEYDDLMSKVATALNEPTPDGARRRKLASAIAINTAAYANDPDGLLKTSYFLEGAKFAAAMMDPAAMAQMEAGAGAPPGGMPPDPAAAGGAPGDPAAGGGQAPPSPEEIEQLVAALVEQGLISPEEAPALIAELTGQGGGGAPGGDPAAGGAPAPEGGEGAPPSGGGEEAAKAAAALVG